MSIVINNQEIGATDLIEAQEISVKEIPFTATDLNEATNTLSAVLDEEVSLQDEKVYCFVVDCAEFTPGVSTKISLIDFDETIENVYGYYNSVTNSYKFYVLHEDDENKTIANVTSVVNKVSSGGGGGTPIDISTDAEMTEVLTSENVGNVYRFTGTTGTYTNGDLYVVEEIT